VAAAARRRPGRRNHPLAAAKLARLDVEHVALNSERPHRSNAPVFRVTVTGHHHEPGPGPDDAS
jgi:hypothetical protein